MQETWYVLENGSYADPNEVAPDKTGALRHKSGVAVAMRGEVPSSVGVDPDQERDKGRKRGANKPDAPEAEAKDMKPEGHNPSDYRRRDVRSR